MPILDQPLLVQSSSTVLGKRKSLGRVTRLLSASSLEISSSPSPIIINGTLQEYTQRRFQCTFDGCGKAYTKPSRLEEHERSHTGERPYRCNVCGNSYLRESHLAAHSRCHLPESSKVFTCSFNQCGKKFWTAQHLRVHMKWHDSPKPFSCSWSGCGETFAKHHQLRTHECMAHAPPGSKPFRCDQAECDKSFASNQQLRVHSKIHNEKRYTCIQESCLPSTQSAPSFFSTWSALQNHMRDAHPPTCSDSACNGKVFSSRKGLRAHQKLHHLREAEAELEENEIDSPNKKRRGGEFNRDWKCEHENCAKEFRSKRALVVHNEVYHLGKRDHVCPYKGCERGFGYKHLLKRHLLARHTAPPDDPPHVIVQDTTPSTEVLNIDTITGFAYSSRAKERVTNQKAVQCPYPNMKDLLPERLAGSGSPCDFVFSRAYDMWRHLQGAHELEIAREKVDSWVLERKSKS